VRSCQSPASRSLRRWQDRTTGRRRQLTNKGQNFRAIDRVDCVALAEIQRLSVIAGRYGAAHGIDAGI
jgi:hypothetical protein